MSTASPRAAARARPMPENAAGKITAKQNLAGRIGGLHLAEFVEPLLVILIATGAVLVLGIIIHEAF